MKKLLLFLIPLLFAGAVFGGFLFFFSRSVSSKGALQVTANPKSKVYLNRELLGETPLCKCKYPDTLTTGDYTLMIVPEKGTFEPFEAKITVEKSTLTVVDRTFGDPTTSDGSIISLKPLQDDSAVEIFTGSFPDKANVLLDNSVAGQTPLLLKNITAADHELTVEKNGYKAKTLHVHTVAGYRLTTIAFLAVDTGSLSTTENASASAVATPSANLTPSRAPSVSPKITPSHTPTPKPSPKATPSPTPAPGSILILDTGTGYLNVHSDASVYSSVVAKVHPGETYTPLDEKNGLFEIQASPNVVGWVSEQYAKKQ